MANEPHFRSPLLLDQDVPYVGNSPGDDERGRVHVKVSNKITEPVPVSVVDGEPGEPFFLDDKKPSTPGVTQTLLTHTVTTAKFYISSLKVSARVEGVVEVFKNSTLVGTARTGAAAPDADVVWNPRRPTVLGDLVEVQFTSRPNSPIVDVGAHLMGLTT